MTWLTGSPTRRNAKLAHEADKLRLEFDRLHHKMMTEETYQRCRSILHDIRGA